MIIKWLTSEQFSKLKIYITMCVCVRALQVWVGIIEFYKNIKNK